ncbi:MAG: hypothetical protein LBV04_06265 [Deferribacteraceae bacterium]|jgi:hypothetical protein|nr:hypothetical protein [Deferribacteraceae bacterium]
MVNKIEEKNEYELFVEQLIGDTETGQVKWEIVPHVPSYLKDSDNNIHKILRTALGDGNYFLVYTFSFQDYSSELDKWYTRDSVNCSFVNNNIVIESFGRATVAENSLYQLERYASRSVFKFDIKKYLRKAE